MFSAEGTGGACGWHLQGVLCAVSASTMVSTPLLAPAGGLLLAPAWQRIGCWNQPIISIPLLAPAWKPAVGTSMA